MPRLDDKVRDCIGGRIDDQTVHFTAVTIRAACLGPDRELLLFGHSRPLCFLDCSAYLPIVSAIRSMRIWAGQPSVASSASGTVAGPQAARRPIPALGKS
jgi:hypothetical protein